MSWLENAWYSGGKLNYVLAPLSLAFWILSSFRRWLFKTGLKKQNQFKVPVIVVGNISVGGTGKTPFVIYLVELLKQQGFNPAIVSRGYGAKTSENHPFPRLITEDSNVELSGDEPKLLALRAGCPVVIDANRSEAVKFAIEQTACDIVISDDGLQHYAMGRDLEFVLLDQSRMFGNGWLLPVGPLRELPSRLSNVDLVVENSGFNSETHEQKNDYELAAQNAFGLVKTDKTLSFETKVHLISGIGNPERFLNTVKGLAFDIVSTTWLPDHHNFVVSDFEQYGANDIVLMTEKDAVKCRELVDASNDIFPNNWYVLPIEAVISEDIEQKILALLSPFKDK